MEFGSFQESRAPDMDPKLAVNRIPHVRTPKWDLSLIVTPIWSEGCVGIFGRSR